MATLSRAMMPPVPAATPTSTLPRRSSPVTEPPTATRKRSHRAASPAGRRWARAWAHSSARAGRRSGGRAPPRCRRAGCGSCRWPTSASTGASRAVRSRRRTATSWRPPSSALGVVQPVVVRPLHGGAGRRGRRGRRASAGAATSSSPGSGVCEPRGLPASSTFPRWYDRPTRSPRSRSRSPRTWPVKT